MGDLSSMPPAYSETQPRAPARPSAGPPGRKEKPIIIAVMGTTGVGKSTFIRAATGGKVVIGDNLESCTSVVEVFQVPSTNVFLMDTPGFDDSFVNDAEILERIASSLAEFFDEKVDVSGILYVHPITDVRMKGSAMKNLNMFRKVIGESNMGSCVLVTTKWGLQDASVSEAREAELVKNPRFWLPLLKQGAKMMRFQDTQTSALDIIMPLAANQRFIPKLTQEYAVEGKKLCQTDAGQEVNDKVEEAKVAHKEEIDMLQKEKERAMAAKDTEFAAMMNEQRLELEKKLKKMEEDQEKLRKTREEERRAAEALAKKMEALRLDNEKKAKEFERRQREQERQRQTDLAAAKEKHDEYLSQKRAADAARQKYEADLRAQNARIEQQKKNRKGRWGARMLVGGAGVALTIASGGLLAPVAAVAYGATEAACQKEKKEE